MDRRQALLGGLVLLVAACKPRIRSFGGEPGTNPNPRDGLNCASGDDSCREIPDPDFDDRVVTAPKLDGAALPKTLVGLKVAIDVGHSARGSDRGAFGGSISEYDLNVIQANQVARELRRMGASVSLFHYPDTTELDERGRNAAGHDVFISIHHNAVVQKHVQGTEVLVDSTTQRTSDQRLAEGLNRQIVDQLWASHEKDMRDRGAKAQRLGVLRNAPSSVTAKCLTESFFISEQGLDVPKARSMTEKAAVGIVKGLVAFHGGQQAKMAMDESKSFVAWPEDRASQALYEDH